MRQWVYHLPVTFIFPGMLFVLSKLVYHNTLLHIYIVRHSHTWEQCKYTQSLRSFICTNWSSVPYLKAPQLIRERSIYISIVAWNQNTRRQVINMLLKSFRYLKSFYRVKLSETVTLIRPVTHHIQCNNP